MAGEESGNDSTHGDAATTADPGSGAEEAVDRRSVLRAIGAGAGLTLGRSSGVLTGNSSNGRAPEEVPTPTEMLDARVEATIRADLLSAGDGAIPDRPDGDGGGLIGGDGGGLIGGGDGGGLPGGEGGLSGALADSPLGKYDPEALQAKTECFRPDQRELYGPTDINAQTGNGRLSVGLNREGTLTVFRWPYPSFYDQLKYFTTGRDGDDAIQVPDNEGSFLGLAVDTGDGFETTWLRDATVESQQYASDRDGGATSAAYSDEVVTTYRLDDLGLRVEVRDLVAEATDALARQVRVERRGDSPVDRARLVAYENFNLVVSKLPQLPVSDWCTEELNGDLARYDDEHDAIVHRKSGVDISTGEPQSVAVAMGFRGESAGHQVGGDGTEPVSLPVASAGPALDAYEDASEGTLSGSDLYIGQTTGAMTAPLEFGPGQGVAGETVVLGAGGSPEAAGSALSYVRDRGFETLREQKEAWFDDLLGSAPLPDVGAARAAEGVDAEALLKLCRRALVTLVTITEDTGNRATVASIATQPPYGEDWVRDGAFFNYALHLAGLDEWVAEHNRWYAEIQQSLEDPELTAATAPPGNWNMNYYGDGVASGPIPSEIDETAYGAWTLWNHFDRTGDREYLRDVYPAIRRAANFMVVCRRPDSDLHCPSFEDDRFVPQTTVIGAATVWLGLQSAARAARTLGRTEDAERFERRRHEIGRAIDAELYDESTGAYGTKKAGFPLAELVWPVGFTPYADPETGEVRDRPQVEDPLAHPRVQSHLDAVYESVAPAFRAPDPSAPDTGQYEVKGLIALAKARRSTGPGRAEQLHAGLDWLATEHATDETYIMGEAWKVFEGADGEREVRSIIGQPHAWEQILTYLCALEAFPPTDEVADGVGGALAPLQAGTGPRPAGR
jgi:hypothetical protein